MKSKKLNQKIKPNMETYKDKTRAGATKIHHFTIKLTLSLQNTKSFYTSKKHQSTVYRLNTITLVELLKSYI